MNTLLILFTAISLSTNLFSSMPETSDFKEDLGVCPPNSTYIRATCTWGCYSAGSRLFPRALTNIERSEATRRLQDYCDSRPLMNLDITPPPHL